MADSEIEILKAADEIFSKVQDQGVRDRVLQWVWAKYSSKGSTLPGLPLKNSPRKKAKPKPGKGSKPLSLSFVKELNLKPKGKKGFLDFAKEKSPTSHFDKCTLAVYYLQHELEIDGVTANHVYTCYKVGGWRPPANLANYLPVIANKRGWLDTRNMSNIKVTTLGETHIEHDLPKKGKEKK